MQKTEVAAGVYFYTDNSIARDYSNSSVVLTEAGPVVIDTFARPEQWQIVEKSIQEAGYQEPCAVIFTHAHLDHVLGLQVDEPRYPIYAHAATPAALRAVAANRLAGLIERGRFSSDTKVVLPTDTFERELTLEFGSHVFRLIHNPWHTVDSIMVYQERTGILFAGDTVGALGDRIAVLRWDDQHCSGQGRRQFLDAVSAMENLNPAVLVPGHGAVTDPGRYFSTIRAYDRGLRAWVRETRAAGDECGSLQTVRPSDIFDKQFAAGIVHIDIGQESTFTANLLSTCNSMESRADPKRQQHIEEC